MQAARVLFLCASIAIGCSGGQSSSQSRPSTTVMMGSAGASNTLASGGSTTETSGEGGAPMTTATATANGGVAPVASSTAKAAGGSTMPPPATMPTTTAPPVTTAPPAGYPYDPNVHFDWPETTPMAGQCRPGTYTGTFQCSLGSAFTPTFSGPVTFTLSSTPNGEFLQISSGTLQANANGAISAMGNLSGQLDCTTNVFHAAITNGSTSILVPFFGRLDGQLDRLTETLTGTWTLAPNIGSSNGGLPDSGAPPLFGCSGTWSVVRQP